MIDNAKFEVRKPLLWFRVIGHTSSDSLFGEEEALLPVFESALAKAGDELFLVAGEIFVKSLSGNVGIGALTLRGTARDNVRNAFALAVSGELSLSAVDYRLDAPPAPPAMRFPDTHAGIVRTDVSPEFSAMVDATETLRHGCEEDATVTVVCSDLGLDRTISLAIIDVETQTAKVRIEIDTASGAAVLDAWDSECKTDLIGSFRDAGIAVSDNGRFDAAEWDHARWADTQTVLARAILRHGTRPVLAMAM